MKTSSIPACSVLMLTFYCALPFGQPQKKDSSAGALPLLALLGAATGSSVSCSSLSASPPSTTAIADTVVSAPGNLGTGFADARCATNGVRGQGDNMGSTDVYSLAGTGTSAVIVLGFNNRKITNSTGTDFAVYENPFNQNGNASTRFMEPIIVEVSYNGSNWCGFNPTYSQGNTYSQNPADWVRFAGVGNVYYNQDTNPMSASTLFTAGSSGGGGDFFDLANVTTTTPYNCSAVVSNSGCAAGDVTTLQGTGSSQGVKYVRLIAATACIQNSTGSAYPQDSGAYGGGPDIDGVIGRYPASLP